MILNQYYEIQIQEESKLDPWTSTQRSADLEELSTKIKDGFFRNLEVRLVKCAVIQIIEQYDSFGKPCNISNDIPENDEISL